MRSRRAGWLLLSTWAGNVAVPPRRFVIALAWTVAATAAMTASLYAPILVRTDLGTLLGTSYILSLKVRPVPWDEFVGGNAGNVVVAWRRWASDWPGWFQAVWLAGIGVAVVLHRRVARTRVPLVAGFALGCVPLLLVQRVVPPARIWIFLLPIFAGMGAAGVLALLGPAMARPRVRERTWRWVAVGSALLLLTGGALSGPARSRQYWYNLAEYPGAEQAVAAAGRPGAGARHVPDPLPLLREAPRPPLPLLRL